MSTALKRWLVMSFVSNAIFSYVGIFVNLFIWEKNHSISEVALYNLFMFVSWSFGFSIATSVLAKTTVRLPLAISAFAGTAAFVMLSTLELDSRLLWLGLIGAFVGIMYSFYNAAHHMSVTVSGKSAELGRYFSALGIIQQTVMLAIPLLSAGIMYYFEYAGTFVLMFVLFLFMLAFTMAMPQFSLRGATQAELDKPTIRWLAQELVRKPGLRWFSASSFAAGVFIQFQMLFSLLFTFSVTENKLWVALLSGLYTCSSFGGMFAYRRLRLKDSTFLTTGVVLIACGLLIVLIPSKPLLIVSNLLTALGMYCFLAAWNTVQFKWVKPYSEAKQSKLLVWRETLLCVTRMALLLVVATLDDLRGPLFYVLLAISLLCLALVPFFEYRAKKLLDQGQSESAVSGSRLPINSKA